MPIVPEKPADKILWYQAHNAPFSANAVAIGTTVAEINALNDLVVAAAEAQVAKQNAADAAKTANTDYLEAVRAMAVAGSEVLKKIKVKAGAVGPTVYSLAQIPPPATPSPVGPPGMPTNFKAKLNPDGSLFLQWKCPNPIGAAGTVYQVARRNGGSSGPFTPIGASGLRNFTDSTLPAGSAGVTYRIQAIRSSQTGVANDFSVNFGVSGSGEATASVMQTLGGAVGGAKLAA